MKKEEGILFFLFVCVSYRSPTTTHSLHSQRLAATRARLPAGAAPGAGDRGDPVVNHASSLPAAASTSPRNSGDGRPGRLLNSGWNWAAT